ncbi:acyl carrier protein [Dactylosporangium sp. NPDC048998]|uniref:acyl carrier protein n=1 Tax=Dactylosporangium sp. NPDC048998 TaxID=3363976 RepID=UPI00371CB7DD
MSELAPQRVREAFAGMWNEILGAYPADDDDFFESGGGSMELVTLLVVVGERFDVSMSIDELFPDDFTFHVGVRAIAAAMRVGAAE